MPLPGQQISAHLGLHRAYDLAALRHRTDHQKIELVLAGDHTANHAGPLLKLLKHPQLLAARLGGIQVIPVQITDL